MNYKRSQIWYSDLILSIVVVLLFLSIFMFTLNNRIQGGDSKLIEHASYISEVLMSFGEPLDWTIDTVKRPGIITSDWRIRLDKVELLYLMDTSKLRTLFSLQENFLIEIYNGTEVMYYSGKNHTGRPYHDPKQISSISRFALIENDVIEVRITSWK